MADVLRFESIRRYIRERLPLFGLCGGVLIMGVVFGAVAVNALNPEAKADLLGYIARYLKGESGLTGGAGGSRIEVVINSILNNMKTVGLIWISAVTVIGAPLILPILFLRGFVIGFTVGFLAREMFLKGVLFAMASVFPHNLIILPILVFFSAASLNFSWSVIKSRIRGCPEEISRAFINALGVALPTCMALILSALIEGFVIPVLAGLVLKVS